MRGDDHLRRRHWCPISRSRGRSGDPLYTLVNPVDDALMKITHVLRGEDLLPSTPRQIALYQALIRIGVADRVPEFAHLPSVLGDGNKKLSKRDPQSNLFLHRERGFIPEGLLNYLALLGWGSPTTAICSASTRWSRPSTSSTSTPTRPGSTRRRPTRINAEHIRLLSARGFHAPGFAPTSTRTATTPVWTMPASRRPPALVQTRIVVLGEAWDLLKFLRR